MRRSPRFPRTPSNLSESCNHRLNTYALAAGAAGLGLLTLASTAEGKIVFTPANVPLANQHALFVDLNHDGVNDFSFDDTSVSNRSVSTFFFRLTISPAHQGNAIWGVESHEHASCAARLPRGMRVGPKRPFQPNRDVLFDASGGPFGGSAYCPWGGKAGTAYLGLKFSIQGRTHFGWARVKIANGFAATLTGYAYETVPGKPILTGKTKGPDDIANTSQPSTAAFNASVQAPITLGMLALGQPALSVWRRRESA